ncbi:hypothetical protein LA6_006206 (plasmid) [Marinibacterium anthonyi]|nr:hypothetical protein LA6_006206 [Marinibacterium anthonyi]
MNQWAFRHSDRSLGAATGLAGGAAVLQGAIDVTPGRLARADHAYGPGNLLGTVSETGGTPTGAVIERGTANGGTHVRWADGTQVCTAVLSLTQAAVNRVETAWTFAMPFAATGDLVVSGMLDATGFATTVTGPGIDEVLAPCAVSLTASGATVRIYRIAGGTDFVAGDTATCRVTAVGRWS